MTYLRQESWDERGSGLNKLDLVVLAADKDMQAGIEGLLASPSRLALRDISYKVFVHPKHDPAVFRQCHDFLRSQHRLADKALVIFDREGCGSAGPRQEIENDVELRLSQNGWRGRAVSVAIDPELEIWAWGGHEDVARVLGWPGGGTSLRTWLLREGFIGEAGVKPSRPKEALRQVLYRLKAPRSPFLYFELARQLAFDGCTDPAFAKLRRQLSEWFPL